MATIITPLGKYLEGLQSYSDLTYHTIDGEVTMETLKTERGDTHAWVFRWQDIREQVVRDNMVKVMMQRRNLRKREAIDYLKSIPSAVAVDEVEIRIE